MFIYRPEFPESTSYETHVPTTKLQKMGIAIGSAFGALAEPARADLVAALGETTGVLAYRRILQKMRVDQEGRVGYTTPPRLCQLQIFFQFLTSFYHTGFLWAPF